MAITKITRDALSTGIDDNSDATAITIDSSERVGLGAAPAKKLTVDGDADFNVALRSASNRTGIGFYTPGTGSLGNPAGSLLLLSDNTFRIGTAAVYGLIMDQSGHVTMPSQPGASAGLSGSAANGSTIVAGLVHHNVGNHYNSSTGVFTCPVGGRYLVSIFAMGNSGSNFTLDIQLRRNNADYQGLVPYNSASGGYHNQVGGMAIVNCSANDTLKFHNGSGGHLYGTSSGRHSCLNFYLLG